MHLKLMMEPIINPGWNDASKILLKRGLKSINLNSFVKLNLIQQLWRMKEIESRFKKSLQILK